jgi:hypothetical protein
MLALSHGLTVGLTLAAVAVVVLAAGLMFGSWARRGSSRKITRDEQAQEK